MIKDKTEQLSKTTVWLHWIVGLSMITLLAVGIFMKENKVYSLYPIHKSVGVLIFTLIVLRIGWRIKNGWPQTIGSPAKFEQILARFSHLSLLIGTAVMPIAGMTMSIAGGRGLSIFDWNLVASNPDPVNAGKVLALNKELAQFASGVHEYVGWFLVVVIVLHVVGALKHHVIDKNTVLKRMLGQSV